MKVCYVCFRFVEPDHSCAVAQKMIDNPAKGPESPFISFDNCPGIKPTWMKTSEWRDS